jgi:gas vesicle protein GvpL/GvpF
MPNALRLYGITDVEHHAAANGDGTELLAFRDLAAIVSAADYSATPPAGEVIEQYRRVVDDVFASAPVLPAPVGTVFRSRETLTRWLELHYVTLSEALTFVSDRAEARVHVSRADGRPDERESGSDLAAAAAEAFRTLRRQSVAAVPLKAEHLTGIVLSSAFLLDKELWSDFASSVQDQQKRNPALAFDLTGPWPPFDFVRMQFGG